jgi:predicted DNA-binding transcriptional regulator AlpA
MQALLESPRASSLPDRTYDAGHLAELFGVTRYTILQWAKRGELPRGRRFGRVLRWTADDIGPLLAARGE